MHKRLMAKVITVGLAAFMAVACSELGGDSPTEPGQGPKFEVVAGFDFTANEADKVVIFENRSENAGSYLWSFGDQSPESSDEDPVHQYEGDGPYVVRLEACKTSKRDDCDTASAVIRFE